MRSRITTIGGISFLFLLLTVASALNAQNAECAAAVQAAFEQLSESCSSAGGNTACYGSGVEANLNDSSSAFSAAGDTVDLGLVNTLHTLPVDGEQPGLALLNVHANVPLAVSEQGLKYLMLGDIEIENAVDAGAVFTPVSSITVTPMVAANLRSAPSTDAQVLASVTVGTELPADGLSADEGWLRVWYEDQLAWISRQIVAAPEGDIGALPAIGSDTNSFMQSFYLSNGASAPSCTDAPPSMLVIESPGGMDASITANGANIRFDGTIGLLVLDDSTMQIVVFQGIGSVGGVPIPAGFTVNVPLTEDGRGVGGLATGLRPITDGERGAMIGISNIVPESLLYQPLTVPSQEEVSVILASINSTAAGQTVSGPAVGQADCSRFKPTSPLGSLASGTTPFYWDGAQGATSYRVNIFGEDGSARTSVEIDANSTTLSLNTGGAIGDGINFSWNVEALVSGQVACTSGTISLPRDIGSQTVGDNSSSEQPQAVPTQCTWC